MVAIDRFDCTYKQNRPLYMEREAGWHCHLGNVIWDVPYLFWNRSPNQTMFMPYTNYELNTKVICLLFSYYS